MSHPTHSISAFFSNYSHLSFVASAVRNTCSGINDVGCKTCQWTHWQRCRQPPLKVMTSRRQVTDIWMFVSAAALSRHFHLSSLCFDAALSLAAFTPYFLLLQHTVRMDLTRQKKGTLHRNDLCLFFIKAAFVFVAGMIRSWLTWIINLTNIQLGLANLKTTATGIAQWATVRIKMTTETCTTSSQHIPDNLLITGKATRRSQKQEIVATKICFLNAATQLNCVVGLQLPTWPIQAPHQ